jgi:hypothetical protein
MGVNEELWRVVVICGCLVVLGIWFGILNS